MIDYSMLGKLMVEGRVAYALMLNDRGIGVADFCDPGLCPASGRGEALNALRIEKGFVHRAPRSARWKRWNARRC